MSVAHIYLRASTKDQDANRARSSLLAFAQSQGFGIKEVYAEYISGTKLNRPELHRLLAAAQKGEILCVESIDRLSRLSQQDWATLKQVIREKGLRLVVMDLPTSWAPYPLAAQTPGEISNAILAVINDMLIDLMATMARLDQEKRVERIKEGIANKKVADPTWKAPGKRRNAEKWATAEKLLKGQPSTGMTIKEIAQAAGVGEATIYRIKKAQDLKMS